MAQYFEKALDPATRPDVIARAVEQLTPLSPNCIAVRGVSGLAVGPIVAHLMGIDLYVARKPGENSHSAGWNSGRLNSRVVILDDFISSGETVREIAKHIPPASIIAIYLYHTIQYPGYPQPLEGVPIIFGL